LSIATLVTEFRLWQISRGGCCQLDKAVLSSRAFCLKGVVIPVEVFLEIVDSRNATISIHASIDPAKIPMLERFSVVSVKCAQTEEIWVVPRVAFERYKESPGTPMYRPALTS
jgi:hypothetical protein